LSVPGSVYRRLFELATEQYGYVTADDARDLEIAPQRLVVMASRGNLEHIAHGLYRFPVIPTTLRDQWMEAALWARRRGVLSHETALELWELGDVSPDRVHVTVPRILKLRRAAQPTYAVHVRDLAPEDTARHEGIPVVTPCRAILDAIESHLSPHLVEQATESARNRGLLSRAELETLHEARSARRGPA
jgi:predicted transcriptional regulator of viral defense system